MKRLYIISCLLVLFIVTCCQKSNGIYFEEEHSSGEIVFYSDYLISSDVDTKATAVSSLSSFYASCVTGTPGNDTQVWTNSSFTGNNTTGYTGNKWWPATNPSYRFYASNVTLSYSASGATVSASNTTDVVCAYASAPAYGSRNTLSFEHIFARLGAVTITADEGYTISDVSIKITPKTGGTYNLRTGAGQTDGTGWSSVTTGSLTTIASTTGSNANDIYLVPGTYTLTASWRAEKELLREDISDMQCEVNLVAGEVNAITASLSGNIADLNVSLSSWTTEGRNIECNIPVPTFGGLQIAPGPLMYENGAYVIKDNWNYDSYGSVYGKNNGSTYFNFVDMGQLFEKSDFSTSDGDIENLLDPLNGWRMPTSAELCTISSGRSPGTSRLGATVNGNSGSKYAILQLTGVTHAGNSAPTGLLLFPDGVTITGKALSGINKATTITSGVTLAELQAYLDQGCAFFPAPGWYNNNGNWGYGGTYGGWWSSSQSGTTHGLYLEIENMATSGAIRKETEFPVILVKPD